MSESVLGYLSLLILIGTGWVFYTAWHEHQYINQLQYVIADCDLTVQLANGMIDSGNKQIADAKEKDWSNYSAMGYALQDLYPMETQENPCWAPTYRSILSYL